MYFKPAIVIGNLDIFVFKIFKNINKSIGEVNIWISCTYYLKYFLKKKLTHHHSSYTIRELWNAQFNFWRFYMIYTSFTLQVIKLFKKIRKKKLIFSEKQKTSNKAKQNKPKRNSFKSDTYEDVVVILVSFWIFSFLCLLTLMDRIID